MAVGTEGRLLMVDLTPADVQDAAGAIIATEHGKPFTGGGFHDWFMARAREAGVPKGLGVHGLRKSAACHLAEQGSTVPEIAALGGWKTHALVQHHIRGANRVLMLKNAMARRARVQAGT